MNYRFFKKKAAQPMYDYKEGMCMEGISISEADKANGSPKIGDMIAVNVKDASDKWLVAKEFMEENYEEVFPNESNP